MSNKLDAVLQTVNLMPAIPKAVQDVLQLLNKDDFSIGDLADAVALDPLISAKVLGMANSAYFGRSRQIDSIEDAALIIGIDAIRSMVLASGLMKGWQHAGDFDMKRFWRLSLLSAYIAKDTAKYYGHNPNRAYTAALLHGLGVLAIHRAIPDIAAEIDRICIDNFPYERADTENQLLGFNHAEVSAAIANEWGLPTSIGEAIRHYPHPGACHATDLSALLHMSVALAINLIDDVPVEEWHANMDVDVKELFNTALGKLPELQIKFDNSKRFVNMIVANS